MRPAPTSPAMPRISPRRSTNDIPERTAAEPLDAQEFLAARVRAARIVVAHVPVRHQTDQLRHGNVHDIPRGHVASVAEDGHALPDAKHLLHPVRDVHHGHAACGQASDRVEQLPDLALAQGGRRLVHDEDARLVGQRPCDLDHLLLREPEAAHAGIGIQRYTQIGEYSRCLTPHPRPVEHAGPPGRGLAQEDVLRHGEVWNETELLIDRADAELSRPVRIAEIGRTAVEEDLASVPAHGTAEDLHQRGLAGAVLAEERMHFAGAHLQGGVGQRLNAGILLADAAHLQQRRRVVQRTRLRDLAAKRLLECRSARAGGRRQYTPLVATTVQMRP